MKKSNCAIGLNDENFFRLMADNTIMHRAVKTHSSFEELVCLLAEENKTLKERILKLELIAPFKIKTENGIEIWRCPEKLVPIRTF